MSKLKNIIKQLSVNDYQAIHDSLMEINAEKSALLLKFMRERQFSDQKIMEELNVNSNAYYTLRSRLNQKIEEYLLQQMETPRITLLKKVATINEILFTKKKAISIATLKKMEKELMDYDLSNELTIIYKHLRKLHIGTPEYYNYSQMYNKHVAYMLALDKSEELVAQYFYKFGEYLMSNEEVEKLSLGMMKQEIDNVANLYPSHRLYIFQSCVDIFHRIFVAPEMRNNKDEDTIEERFAKVQNHFDTYHLDATYHHLKPVFEYLKSEYIYYVTDAKKVEVNYDVINSNASTLLTNYHQFTFPSQFLITKLNRHISSVSEKYLYDESKKIFEEFEVDKSNVSQHVIYVLYRALTCYYVGKYEESARWVNGLLNEQSLKKTPYLLVEIKLFLSLLYCLMKDNELYGQLSNSIQRQVRVMGKEKCNHVLLYLKVFKISIGREKKGKQPKIQQYLSKVLKERPNYFTPFKFIKMDTDFIERLSQ